MLNIYRQAFCSPSPAMATFPYKQIFSSGTNKQENKLYSFINWYCFEFDSNWLSVSGEYDTLKSITYNSAFQLFSIHVWGVIIHFYKLESPLPPPPKMIAKWFRRKAYFDVIDINIHVFSWLSLPLNIMWPLISTNMNMAIPGMLCLKLGWSLHIGCGDENIKTTLYDRFL